MRRDQALREALEIAQHDQIRMALVATPYSGEPELEQHGYHPLRACSIFEHEPILAILEPCGRVAHRLEAWGCYVWMEGHSLVACELGDYERGDEEQAAVEVSAPESQAFLDDVNQVLGTEFEFDQFAGR